MARNNFHDAPLHSRDVMLPRKNISRNYYYCDQDDNSLGLCFKSMYLTLIVAIFISNFIFSMFKSFHTCRNINISNLTSPHQGFLYLKSLKSCQELANHLKASQLDSKAPQHVQVCEARAEGTDSVIITTLDLLCKP